MFYSFEKNSKISHTVINKNFLFDGSEKYIAVISAEKVFEYDFLKTYLSQFPMLLTDFSFSKIEIFSDFIYGNVGIPEAVSDKNIHFAFISNGSNIIFVDKNNYIMEHLNNIINRLNDKLTSAGNSLYYILDDIISDDLSKMNTLQQNLAQLEQDILDNKEPNALRNITECRHNAMKIYHYYTQLSGICSDLQNNTQNLFDAGDRQLFATLYSKISLLCRESQQIWEYTSQIRDVYQQQLEVHQNGIMKILTIVTTIFMPLTLITGWYGMNFVHMPELSKPYSYPTVLGISLLIAIVLCVIFKKKKWW